VQIHKKYNVIYADPPWSYVFSKTSSRSVTDKYPVMSSEDLININIPSADNSVLLMWATYPKLKEAINLGEKWGFEYKTVAFTWIKKNKIADTPFVGMGYYTRSNAEIVLLFTKGKPIKRVTHDVEQILFSEIGKHSQKPDEVRKRIVRLFGDVPRLELFARSREGFFPDYEYEGWDVFGNEVNNSITL
jgi:N6-adenosine-specific RNA methylase IME4